MCFHCVRQALQNIAFVFWKRTSNSTPMHSTHLTKISYPWAPWMHVRRTRVVSYYKERIWIYAMPCHSTDVNTCICIVWLVAETSWQIGQISIEIAPTPKFKNNRRTRLVQFYIDYLCIETMSRLRNYQWLGGDKKCIFIISYIGLPTLPTINDASLKCF